MRKMITLLVAIAAMQFANASSTTDTVSTGASYVNQIWYSLPNDEQGSTPKDNWDVAFEISGYAASVLANTQKGMVVYQSPYAVAQWGTVDTTGLATWKVLENGETSWSEGALNTNPDNNYDLGWGVYDMNTHSVTGDSIYVIRLASGGYKKLKINSLANSAYSFTWADIDGQNEQTASLAKSGYTGKNFGYYSLENNAALDREPATADWDITFTKYMTVIYAPAPTLYGVTGVLLNKGVTGIKASGVDVASVDYNNFTFQTDINTIGYNWKSFAGTWTIEDSLAFFVKRSNGDIWKLIFTGFSGSAAGNYIFSKEQVYTATTGIQETEGITTLGIYPNPAHNQLNIVYNYNRSDNNSTNLTICDLSGRVVMQQGFNATSGLNNQVVDVTGLNTGIYLLNVGGKTSKLIIE